VSERGATAARGVVGAPLALSETRVCVCMSERGGRQELMGWGIGGVQNQGKHACWMHAISRTLTHIRLYTHARAPTGTLTGTHPSTRSCARAHTHTHTHTCSAATKPALGSKTDTNNPTTRRDSLNVGRCVCTCVCMCVCVCARAYVCACVSL